MIATEKYLAADRKRFEKLSKRGQIAASKERAIKCYDKYNHEYEHVRQLLELKLNQIAALYTMKKNLPRESVRIFTRVKSLSGFIKKLEGYKWPYFYLPSDVVNDFIGARVICWFENDCYEFLKLLKKSDLRPLPNSLFDRIEDPKPSGYRSIHLDAAISYHRMVRNKQTKAKKTISDSLGKAKMKCEIQIRTKLQDVFGDLTHEFYYKEGKARVGTKKYEPLLASLADALAVQDKQFMQLRDIHMNVKMKKNI